MPAASTKTASAIRARPAEDSTAGLADKLMKLQRLHEVGFLSDHELRAAKAELLD